MTRRTGFAIPSPMSAPHLFDRELLSLRRERAAAVFAQHDFLHREAAARLIDRLEDMQRDFARVLLLGGHGDLLPPSSKTGTRIEAEYTEDTPPPFAPESFDAVLSLLALHHVNDVPGALIHMARLLKPDGLLLAILPGGDTLRELRDSLMQAEIALTGGASPRVFPFMDVRDAGSLLQRAGLALPVVECERIALSYSDLPALLRDVRGAGETNILAERSRHIPPRGLFALAAAHYHAQYADSEGRLPCTVELLTLTAWKPAATQQKPAPRGSARFSLKEALR